MKITEESSKRSFATGYTALLIGGMFFGFVAFSQPTRAATTYPVGIAIPLYTYPTDGTWAAIIQAKQSYPNVPFIAVINPNSGPGSSLDSNYVQGIKNLQAAGVKVLGYVATGYAGNSISSEESQVSAYESWYGVNGIFFDEMSNSGTTASYYSTLNTYVHSLIPGSTTMGNPGTSVDTALIGTLDILCIYESSGYPTISFLTYPGYAPTYFSNIVYGVSLSNTFLTGLAGVNSWTYLTDAGGSNPYDVLPSYFTSEVAALSSTDGNLVTTSSTSSSSTSSSTSGTSAVTVNSDDLSGAAITGMWTTFNQNGALLSTGYTPMTFTGNNGGTYVVTVANYGSTVFCHWQDGSTNPDLTVTLSGSRVLTAYYSTTGSCSTTTTSTTTTSTSSTKSTTTSTSSTSTTKSTTISTSATSTTTTKSSTTPASFSITVKSATTSGSQLNGMWTVVTQNGVTVTTGYTPISFTATTGGSYTVSVANYGNYVFSHWSTGSSSSTITITPTQATTLTAYYSVITCSPHHKGC